MFGGLEIKSNKDEADEQAVAPAPASAFGFLNAGSEAAAPAPAASSSFSFMNPTPAPVAEEAAPAPAALSGFSFMMPDISATDPLPSASSQPPTAEPPTPASGFSFLIPSPSNDEAEKPEAAALMDAPPTESVQASSAFSFLSSPATSTDAADPPSLATMEMPAMLTRDITSGSAASSVVSAPSPTPPNFLETALPSSTSSGFPTGTGVTFGTSAKRNVVKKKKTRATRIGAGAAGTPPIPPAAPAPPAAAPVVSAPAPTPTAETKSARDEALEAAKRAEEFMQNKAIAEARAAPSREKSPISNGPPDIAPTNSTDSVLAAAQKAAEEAKILQQQHQKGGGFMGTFFKGFRASPNTTGVMSGSSNSSLPPLGHETSKRSIPEPSVQPAQPPNPTLQDDDDDDDMIVVSSKVGSYQPEPIEDAPGQTSTFTPVTLPSAETSSVTLGTKTSSAFSPSKPLEIKNFIVPEVKAPLSLPTPKKSKTPIQVFEEYQALFAQSVHRAMEQVENVRSQQKMLSEERFVSLAKDRLAAQQIEQTEQQLQTAVEEEDYELADQLGQVLEGHKREKHEVGLMLENISKALAQLDSQKELVVQSVATCFDNLAVRLEELKDKETAFEQKDDEETLKQFASISKQLSAEQERLQQDLKHLERDEQLVAEERKELENAIKEQTGEIEIQKDEATRKLEEVQKEVDELRRQLEAKQKEAADLRTEMFGFEDAISKVRVKFSRQLTRVDKKERALKESRTEWELEESTHKKQKEAHELQVQSHSEALLAHDALMKSLNSELRLAKDFCELIPEQLGFMDEITKDDEAKRDGEEGDLAQLQADVVKCEAAVSEAKILLKAATSVLANLQAERDSLLARIPQLESLKKEAAAKRDFKSASKASKEIKDATARIKECEEELNGDAESKKNAAEEELARLDAELSRTRELANEKEKVSGLEKMASLAKRISQLVEKKKEICGESESDENSVKGVGALVLDGQIKALKAEGRDLGSKYGGWTELMNEMQMDDEADSPVEETTVRQASKPPPKVESATPEESTRPDDGLTIEERVKKVKSLVAKLKKAEVDLESAAAEEDFEKAAALQETIETLASEIADIDLPEDLLANAVSGDSQSEEDGEDESDPQVETEPSTEEEEKKDTSEEEVDTIEEVEVTPDVEISKDEDADQSIDDDDDDDVDVDNGAEEPLEKADSDDQDESLQNNDDHLDEDGNQDEDAPSRAASTDDDSTGEVIETVSTDETV